VTFGLSEAADVRGEIIASDSGLTSFRALGVKFETSLSGRHAVMNLLAAIAVAHVYGIQPATLRDAVYTFAVGKMRGERIDHNGIVVWNDCYNSNPEAAQSMLDVLAATPAGRRVAVLGEMLELGYAAEELHRRVGLHAASVGVDVLIGIGEGSLAMVQAAATRGVAAQLFDDPAEAGDQVRFLTQAGDAVLFKGSRGVHVERALERFMA
jgi:UDP-N-acetylmuramoyl-tripeptide--D-alanyl-D-alanine ligase